MRRDGGEVGEGAERGVGVAERHRDGVSSGVPTTEISK